MSAQDSSPWFLLPKKFLDSPTERSLTLFPSSCNLGIYWSWVDIRFGILLRSVLLLFLAFPSLATSMAHLLMEIGRPNEQRDFLKLCGETRWCGQMWEARVWTTGLLPFKSPGFCCSCGYGYIEPDMAWESFQPECRVIFINSLFGRLAKQQNPGNIGLFYFLCFLHQLPIIQTISIGPALSKIGKQVIF